MEQFVYTWQIVTLESCSGGSRIFPGGRQPPGGAPGYDFIKFSRKLHEIEKNLVARGGAPPP